MIVPYCAVNMAIRYFGYYVCLSKPSSIYGFLLRMERKSNISHKKAIVYSKAHPPCHTDQIALTKLHGNRTAPGQSYRDRMGPNWFDGTNGRDY